MFSEISWSPGLLSWVALGMISLGLVLWFIIRRQKKRLWLPILQVLPLELTAMPKLRWTKPPLWPLVCFILAGLALGLFSFEPSEAIMKRENLDLRYTHVFFDMSPSMSVAFTLDDYAREAGTVMQRLDQNTRVSFSFSGSPGIYGSERRGDIPRLVKDHGFHRAGLKIGAAVESILSNSPDIEHLIVFSDGDRASWEDFNWRYLEKKVQISWFPVSRERTAAQNVFIDDVKPRSDAASDRQANWVLVIRRSGSGESLKGSVSARVGDSVLAEQAWVMDGNASSIDIEVQIPPEFFQKNKAEDAVVVWTLTSTGEQDMLADNSFRSSLKLQAPSALLIAQPHGEMFLEDSVFHLKTSLDVLGMQTKRVDRINDEEAVTRDASLIVAEAEGGFPRSFFCPQQRLKNGRGDFQFWLLPSAGLRDYEQICSCAAAFIQAPRAVTEVPNFCRDLQTRDQYIGVLQSLGALQLGGEVGSSLGALAMQYINKQTRTRLLAFTVPLQPSPETGISYGQLPLLLKALFDLAPLESSDEQANDGRWPRIDDISKEYGNAMLALSNVPFLESALQQLSAERLPPTLQFGSQGMLRQSALANREKDARPWILICLWIVAASIWLEIVGLAIGRMFKGRAWALRWFGLICLLVLLPAPEAEAQVRLNLVGYSKIPALSTVRRDVSSRTSIDLLEIPRENAAFSHDALSEPWLWIAQPSYLESLSGPAIADLLAWIQRGGFLIIENHRGNGFKARIKEAIPAGDWKPIPPDHELMRSFHLLSSLPQCNDTGWEGFHFDQRIAVLTVPGNFLENFLTPANSGCFASVPQEQSLKIFINIMMVVLTTDYKNDQIHLPEILKRLR